MKKSQKSPEMFLCQKQFKHLFKSAYFDGSFKKAEEFTKHSAETIFEHILREKNPNLIVRKFDRLSDTFCNLLDGLECIRNIHPDEMYRDNANKVFDSIAPLMYAMNSDRDLLNKLQDAIDGGIQGHPLMVAETLKKDFQKSGAHLPEEIRGKAEELSNKHQQICSRFIQESNSKGTRQVPVSKEDLRGIEHHLQEFIETSNGEWLLNVNIHSGMLLLTYCESEPLRKLAHLIVTNATAKQLKLFEEMIRIRYDIAQLQGYNSYTELTKGDRVLKSTEDIMKFIKIYDKANLELILSVLDKMRDHGALADWNTLYTMSKLHNSRSVPIPLKSQQSPYTVKNVLKGVNFALLHLFGIQITKLDDPDDLLMHSKIEKYAVNSPQGLLGYIYFDLFNRDGAPKLCDAAHFTIRCSRRVDWDSDLSFNANCGKIWENDSSSFGKLANKQGKYQRPVVVLATSFEDEKLSFYEASTIFHEIGHAIHTMLGSNQLQMLSGTRCKHDIAEIPSIFMEKMCLNPYVLHHVFGSDYNNPIGFISYSDIDTIRKDFGIVNQKIPSFESPLEVLEDVWTSVVDQALHSDLVGKMNNKDYFTCGIVAGLQEANGLFGGPFSFKQIQRDAFNTKYASFPHLTGYGACYYSYMFAKAIADKMHTQQNTFYDSPKNWKKNGLAEQFMSFGGYHTDEFLNRLISK